jgi:peptide/nickel transport system substrate-binding protein
MSPTRRHELTRRAAIGAGAALWAGLTPARAQTATDARQAAPPRRAITVLCDHDAPGLDPHLAAGAAAASVARNVYDTLVRVEGGRATPSAATQWRLSDDGRVAEFRILEGATFHSGAPIDAEAARFSIQRLLRLGPGPAWALAETLAPEGVEAVAPDLLRLSLKAPHAALLGALSTVALLDPTLVAPNLARDEGRAWLRTHVAGSGPFTIRSVEPGERIVFERVAGAWRGGGGDLASVSWQVEPDAAAQRLRLQRGEAQLVVGLSAEAERALAGRAGVTTLVAPSFSVLSLRLRMQGGPFADAALRRATIAAFDAAALAALAAPATALAGPLPPPWGEPLAAAGPDLAAARAEMAQAKAPERPVVVAYVEGRPGHGEAAELLRGTLAGMGLPARASGLSLSAFVAAASAPEPPDAFVVEMAPAYPDPDALAWPGWRGAQPPDWRNPGFASDVADATILEGRTRFDVPAREVAYRRLARVARQEAAAIFGVATARRFAYASDLIGFAASPGEGEGVDFSALRLA